MRLMASYGTTARDTISCVMTVRRLFSPRMPRACFLGLPMQCAECHDHKIEVWTQEDYYGIAAFFAGIDSQRKGDIQTMDMIGNERRMDNFLITNKPEDSIWVRRLEKHVRPHFLDGTEYKGSLLKKAGSIRTVDD